MATQVNKTASDFFVLLDEILAFNDVKKHPEATVDLSMSINKMTTHKAEIHKP